MAANQFLNTKWAEELVPILNGIIYPDGTRVPIAFSGDSLEVGRSVSWSPSVVGDNLTYFTELCRVELPLCGICVVGGEGGLGTDGIIGAIRLETQTIAWILFQDNSNPFIELKVQDSKLIAVTSLDQKWAIDLRVPTVISVGARA